MTERIPQPKDHRKSAGTAGEQFAWQHYQAEGYHLLARNWRLRTGELDLVLQSLTGDVVFAEVRSRMVHMSSQKQLQQEEGWAMESITPAKRNQLRKLANAFLHAHPHLYTHPVRFDVVAVLLEMVHSTTSPINVDPTVQSIESKSFELVRLNCLQSAF